MRHAERLYHAGLWDAGGWITANVSRTTGQSHCTLGFTVADADAARWLARYFGGHIHRWKRKANITFVAASSCLLLLDALERYARKDTVARALARSYYRTVRPLVFSERVPIRIRRRRASIICRIRDSTIPSTRRRRIA